MQAKQNCAGVLAAFLPASRTGHMGTSSLNVPVFCFSLNRLQLLPPTKWDLLRRGYTFCHEHPPFGDKHGAGENSLTPEEGSNNDGPSEGRLVFSVLYSIKVYELIVFTPKKYFSVFLYWCTFQKKSPQRL